MKAVKKLGTHWIDLATALPYPPIGPDGRQHQPLAQLAPGDTYEDENGKVWTVAEVTIDEAGNSVVRAIDY